MRSWAFLDPKTQRQHIVTAPTWFLARAEACRILGCSQDSIETLGAGPVLSEANPKTK
jgi:hypothetical protein